MKISKIFGKFFLFFLEKCLTPASWSTYGTTSDLYWLNTIDMSYLTSDETIEHEVEQEFKKRYCSEGICINNRNVKWINLMQEVKEQDKLTFRGYNI